MDGFTSFIREEAEALARPGALDCMIGSECCFLNHGGLGSPPRAIVELRRHAEDLCEKQPMRWCRDEAPRLVSRARSALCDYLSISDPARLVLTSNASAAIFSVLQSVALAPGDVVLTTETVYHSVGDALRHLCARAGAVVHTVPLLPPGLGGVRDEAQMLGAWEAGLDGAMRLAAAGGEGRDGGSGGRVAIAVLDHISSKPSAVFPAAAMVAACAARGVPTLVDGAHAPGSLSEEELQLDALGADFYAMNFHKWMHAPRPCAALYVRYPAAGGVAWIDHSRLTPKVLPPGPPALSKEASYVTDVLTQGHYDESTRDYAHFVVLHACVELARRLEEPFQRHRAEMVPFTVRALRDACGTGDGAPDIIPAERCAAMATVRMPTARMMRVLLQPSDPSGRSLDGAVSAIKLTKGVLKERLLTEFGIEVPVFVFRGELFLRVSLPLYVQRPAITRLAQALSTLLAAGPGTSRL